MKTSHVISFTLSSPESSASFWQIKKPRPLQSYPQQSLFFNMCSSKKWTSFILYSLFSVPTGYEIVNTLSYLFKTLNGSSTDPMTAYYILNSFPRISPGFVGYFVLSTRTCPLLPGIHLWPEVEHPLLPTDVLKIFPLTVLDYTFNLAISTVHHVTFLINLSIL